MQIEYYSERELPYEQNLLFIEQLLHETSREPVIGDNVQLYPAEPVEKEIEPMPIAHYKVGFEPSTRSICYRCLQPIKDHHSSTQIRQITSNSSTMVSLHDYNCKKK